MKSAAPSAISLCDCRSAMRADFYTFMLRCFSELNSGSSFLPSWHIEVLAAKLQAVRDGRTRRLIVNIPPRHLKSLAASIALPAWLLGHEPNAGIVGVSYGQELSDKLARDCRAVMMSSRYRSLFATRLSPNRPSLQELVTTAGGFRLATSVGGVLTGRGADFVIIDDPLKPGDAMSESRRVAANEWFDGTLYSRLNDKTKGVIVIIMQRLHEDDLVGHVLRREGWDVLSFPAIAETDERHVVETPFGRRTFERRTGEALHPERESLETLGRIRASLGEYNFAGQYQQNPAPAGGGMIKEAWFRRFRSEELPSSFDRVVQSWDTANKPTELADYSVCTTWGARGPELLSPERPAQKTDLPRAEARGSRAERDVQADRDPHRGQGLRDPADSGADRRRSFPRRALQARRRQDHAPARAVRDDRERLRPFAGNRPLAFPVLERTDHVSERTPRRSGRFDRTGAGLGQTAPAGPRVDRALSTVGRTGGTIERFAVPSPRKEAGRGGADRRALRATTNWHFGRIEP